MKIKIVLIGTLMLALAAALPAQSIVEPWHVFDCGGGKSTSGSFALRVSIGQAAIQAMSATATNLEGGYIPGLRNFSGTTSILTYVHDNGWNMLSVPYIVSDFHASAIYPGAVSPAFGYSSGYFVPPVLAGSAGYWLRFGGTGTIPITGTTVQQESVTVAKGWNLVGPPSFPVLLSDIIPVGTSISSRFFGYTTALGYYVEDTLKPGLGYWINVNQAGTLFMKTGNVIIEPVNHPTNIAANKRSAAHTLGGVKNQDGIGYVGFVDSEKKERVLFFSGSRTDVNPALYDLPPFAPPGVMDARYSTNRLFERVEQGKERDIAVLLSSAVYPVTITAGLGKQGVAVIIDGRATTLEDGKGVSLLKEPSHIILRFTPNAEVDVPKRFLLHQNYPNPFNPSTTIRYDLPTDARVTLRIYDAIGREVTVVKNEIENAGYRTADWNAGRFASGVYFYRLEATSIADPRNGFTEVLKMVLLK
jgi:hypothetical protein